MPVKIPPRLFCIIRISSLGDVLLISPLLRQIRRHYPDVRIDVITGSRFADVLRFNPHITSLIEMETGEGIRGILAARRAAKHNIAQENFGKYDVLIDLQRNLRSGIFRIEMARSVGKLYKHRLQKIALVRWKHGIGQPVIPVPLRYTLTARNYGVNDDGGGLELWLPEEQFLGHYPPDKRMQFPLKRIHERPLRIAFAPGARHFTKRWPAERFAALGVLLRQRFGAEITLLGGMEDAELCRNIAGMLSFPVHNLAETASIFDSARALDQCDAAIVNDSAAMHIAVARRCPLVAVFGSTVKELGFAPFRSPFVIAEADVSCRPCSHIGRDTCPEGHFRCMVEISPDSVLELMSRLLNGLSGS